MKKTILIAAFLTQSFLAQSVFAAYTGPETSDFTKVKDVVEKGFNHSSVKLEGFLIKRLSYDRFLFEDETSKIEMKISSRLFPEADINEKTKVVIRGELEKKKHYTEVEAKTVEIAK
jgi:uncharacterized protein (TIGR00156 family)